MHKIFISYSRSDFAKVVKLKDEIEQLKILIGLT